MRGLYSRVAQPLFECPVVRVLRWWTVAVFFFLGQSRSMQAVEGIIPNLTYVSTQQWKQISPKLSSLHLNQPSVFNGYLVLAGNAVHEIWDISNPYNPAKKKTITSPFAAGEAESHQVTYSRSASGTWYMATISGKGVDIWNMTVTTNPVLLSSLQLPNINYGDVAGAIWGVAWQGNYIYAGATVNGLYVIDASNPSAPQHVKTLSQANLGGVSAGPLFAMGNLLVITTPKDTAGIATVDITNPLNPLLLDSVSGGANSYIGGFYGGNAYLITPLRTYDVTSDPANIQLLGSSTVPASEYMSFANNHLFLGGLRGGTEGVYKYSITNPASPTLIGRFVGRNPAWDDQFSCPIGNLMAVADDQLVNNQYVGGLLAVHDLNPDTSPPTVLKVFPSLGTTDLSLNTRIAVSMSEWPEFATVNSTSFFVRAVGGEPIAGSWSCTYTLMNFTPAEPLLPNTMYEVVLPSGGVRDLVGNAIATQFVSSFQTGSGITGYPGDPDIAPVPPTELGDVTTLSVASTPPTGATYVWDFGDGFTNAGSSVNHTYADPGRYSVTLRATQSNANYEAENATLSGGITTGTEHVGFSGTGYADYPGTTGTSVYVRWTVTILSTSVVDLAFRYANGGGTDRPLHLIVNGGAASSLSFPATASWSNYATAVRSNILLNAGTNTIELRATAGSVGANLDLLSLRLPNPQTATKSFTHIVYRPLTTFSPTHSAAMALDIVRGIVWAVNPDHDTVTAVDINTMTKLGEYAVGNQPETLDIAPDGSIWVANHGGASISVLNSNGSPATTIDLPYASQPYGLVISPSGSNAYVALQALGRVVKLNTATRAITASLTLPSDTNGIRPQIRGVAVTAYDNKLYVSRFMSPDSSGQVYEINPASSMSLMGTINLASDPGPDHPMGSRGIPNYLNSLTVSPDGTRVWIPSKKDNIQRGVYRDGNNLTQDLTVRAISSVIEISTGLEIFSERIDFDNQDRAHSLCFSPLGDLAFLTMPGNNHIQVVDAYSGANVAQLPTEITPTAVLFDPASNRIFALNLLSRSLSAYDASDLVNGVDNNATAIGSPVSLTATETLATNVLTGKRLFYDATSTRLNLDGYMSCASCHLDGSHDGRVWDLTGFGEGIRNTIDLRGRGGMEHGRLHWSANFDEVQDFEGQIRNLGSGTGLMNSDDYNAETRAHPLGVTKRGFSEDLDALADYVASLNTVPPSPYRDSDGTLTADAEAGRSVFEMLSCYNCHGGAHFTDSSRGGFHDVGTLKASSGDRLGGALTGIDTPTLRGLWATAPYLHDGSAPTVSAVFTSAAPASAHDVSSLNSTQLNQLIAFLNQIDETEPDALPVADIGILTYSNFVANNTFPGGQNQPGDDPDGDARPNLLEFAAGDTEPDVFETDSPLAANRTASQSAEAAPNEFRFSFLRLAGGFWQNGAYHIGGISYTPEASIDLANWAVAVTQTENPANLTTPPTGYEWITFRMVTPPAPDVRAFGRLRVRK